MADLKIQYSFTSTPWQYTGKGGWIFISLPKKLSEEIRDAFKHDEEGWGRLAAKIRIGSTEWKTAIWFDTKTPSMNTSPINCFPCCRVELQRAGDW